MSADSSPKSESVQNSRYQRAREQVQTDPQLDRERDRQRQEHRRREATERQARQDRGARGHEKILNDVAALLGGDDSGTGKGDGNPSHASRPGAGGNGAAATVADGPGRGGGQNPPDEPRPGLEFDADEDSQDEQPKRRRKARAAAEWAAEHEVELKELYGLEVSFEEGGPEPVTIGALKDAWKDRHDLQGERDRFDDWRTDQQNEVLQARTELELTVQELAAHIEPEAIARATKRAQQQLRAQVEKSRGQLLEWFPEWSDAQRKIADRDAFAKLMATYGFSAAEVGGVIDARLIKFGMDAMRLMAKYKRMREGERERKPSTQAPAKGKPKVATKDPLDRAREQKSRGDEIGAVATLLGG